MGNLKVMKLAGVTLAACVSTSLYAGGDFGPLLEMTVLRNQISEPAAWNDIVIGTDQGGGTWNYAQTYEDPLGDWDINYDLSYSTGATTSGSPTVVTLTFGLTNNTGGPETYTVNASLPLLAALGPDYVVAGSVEGTLGDANFDGSASISSAGGPVYSGLVDGAAALTLLNDPFSFAGVPFSTAPFGPDSAGLPGVSIPGLGGPASTDIGIEITFTLSDGDSASFTADFFVKPVPAPGALAVLGLGLVGARRRRRS